MAFDSMGIFQSVSQLKTCEVDDLLSTNSVYPSVENTDSNYFSYPLNWDTGSSDLSEHRGLHLRPLSTDEAGTGALASYSTYTMHDLLSSAALSTTATHTETSTDLWTQEVPGFVGIMPLILRDGDPVYNELCELPSLDSLGYSLDPCALGLDSPHTSYDANSIYDEDDLFDGCSDSGSTSPFADISGNDLDELQEWDDEFEEVVLNEVAHAVQEVATKEALADAQLDPAFIPMSVFIEEFDWSSTQPGTHSTDMVDELEYPDFELQEGDGVHSDREADAEWDGYDDVSGDDEEEKGEGGTVYSSDTEDDSEGEDREDHGDDDGDYGDGGDGDSGFDGHGDGCLASRGWNACNTVHGDCDVAERHPEETHDSLTEGADNMEWEEWEGCDPDRLPHAGNCVREDRCDTPIGEVGFAVNVAVAPKGIGECRGLFGVTDAFRMVSDSLDEQDCGIHSTKGSGSRDDSEDEGPYSSLLGRHSADLAQGNRTSEGWFEIPAIEGEAECGMTDAVASVEETGMRSFGDNDDDGTVLKEVGEGGDEDSGASSDDGSVGESDSATSSEDIVTDFEDTDEDGRDPITGYCVIQPDEDFMVSDEMWEEATRQLKRAYRERAFEGDEPTRKRRRFLPRIPSDIYEAESFVLALAPTGFFQAHILDDIPHISSAASYRSLYVES